MKKLNCPSCGGNMDIDPKTGIGVCKSCGTKVQLADYTEVKTKRIVDEARIKEADVKLRELEINDAQRKEEHRQRVKAARIKIPLGVLLLIIGLGFLIVSLVYGNTEETGGKFTLASACMFPAMAGIAGGIILLATSRKKPNVNNNASSKEHSVNVSKAKSGDVQITVKKDKATLLILCIFGGFFGLHQFYAKKIGMGILYIFTAGLFMIGWIIDIVRIANGTFEQN